MGLQNLRFFIALLLALSGVLHSALVAAQGAAVADPAAISSALTDEQRAQARQLFATGFELWQGGDCAAAVLAFGQGLSIDPANPQANFYRGDCLQKLRRREEAAEAFKRAMTYGAGTPEGFKAQAAFEALSKPLPFSELSPSERKRLYVGDWILESWNDAVLSISLGQDGSLQVGGAPGLATCPWCRFTKLEYQESDGSIRFTQDGGIFADIHFRMRLVGADRMTGEVIGGPARGQRMNARRK